MEVHGCLYCFLVVWRGCQAACKTFQCGCLDLFAAWLASAYASFLCTKADECLEGTSCILMGYRVYKPVCAALDRCQCKHEQLLADIRQADPFLLVLTSSPLSWEMTSRIMMESCCFLKLAPTVRDPRSFEIGEQTENRTITKHKLSATCPCTCRVSCFELGPRSDNMKFGAFLVPAFFVLLLSLMPGIPTLQRLGRIQNTSARAFWLQSSLATASSHQDKECLLEGAPMVLA